MPNENFYVFKAPLPFDPSQSHPNPRDVRRILNSLPRTTEPNPLHDIMNNALKEWVENESKKAVKDDEIIHIYKNEVIYDGRSTSTYPYYYLEWQPDVNFESWYLHMINTANAHGYTVYSDVDFSVYLPDGTSIPPNAHSHLEFLVRLQQNRIDKGYDTVLKIMQEEADFSLNPNQMSKHLFNADSRVMIITAILQHCLDKHGIQATISHQKGEEFKITCDWQDKVNFTVSFMFSILFDFKIETVRYSFGFDRSYKPQLQEKSIKLRLLNTPPYERIFWDKTSDFYINACEKYQKNRKTLEPNIWSSLNNELNEKNTANTVTTLHTKLNGHIDEFVKNVYGYGNLYDFIDACFQETHPLHNYLWKSVYEIPELGNLLLFARFVRHPKLPEMTAKQLERKLKAEKLHTFISDIDKRVLINFSNYAEKYYNENKLS